MRERTTTSSRIAVSGTACRLRSGRDTGCRRRSTGDSTRDSQYAVSIRQPRFAESCELGLARDDDERLIGMLARLYDPDVPRSDTGRAGSTADAERNLPATGLTRADLSWRSLLFAREQLPPLVVSALESDLLPA